MKSGQLKKGFTLMEILIVVLILGMLLAIGVPSLIHARNQSYTNTCVQNLWQIEQAKEQCAMAANLPDDALIGEPMLVPTYMPFWPECPKGGIYQVNLLGQNPTCSIGGTHTLIGTGIGNVSGGYDHIVEGQVGAP